MAGILYFVVLTGFVFSTIVTFIVCVYLLSFTMFVTLICTFLPVCRREGVSFLQPIQLTDPFLSACSERDDDDNIQYVCLFLVFATSR